MLLAPAAYAQVQNIDPNTAIDADLNHGATAPAVPSAPAAPPATAPMTAPAAGASFSNPAAPSYGAPGTAATGGPVGGPSAAAAGGDSTYHENELVNAAEGVFGKGARGLALMIRDLLKKQGEPNAYITGSEGGGAVVVGVRYGRGTLHHKIEGQSPVFWTGPSIGFDLGGSGGSTFVLIYNLHDTEKLFQRIAAGEGQAYMLGGFNVSYMRRGDLVVIPVRMGGGMRLGVNAGYMNFTHKVKWVPF
ncbi:EipA family protein [Novosphingobium sp.]|uniref:EipA family protein n=1 Tax=Novosphingobium sp. TaxID=1874826 RepID=UPI00334052BA